MKSRSSKNRSRFAVVPGLLCAATMTMGAQAVTVFVDGTVGQSGDGLSWGSPFKYLHDALVYASNFQNDVDQIWVAAAEYYPDECDTCGPNGTDLRSDTFELVNLVKVYGGFLNGDVFEDRDPIANETILSGDIDQNDGPGEFENNDNNSYHVVSAGFSVGSTTLVDGFSIQQGFADGTGFLQKLGAGLIFNDGEPLIRNCLIQKNKAADFGGGAYVFRDGSTFVLCRFRDNVAGLGGGALLQKGATFPPAFNLVLVDCEF